MCQACAALTRALSRALGRGRAGRTPQAGQAPLSPQGTAGRLALTRRCSAPRGLGALEDPIFHSGCEGELGIALESLQGKRDLI